jgi:hypothetical protein
LFAFHNRIFFLCFRFMAVVLGHPEGQTVSLSSPKLCVALQRKFRSDEAAYRVDPAGAFRFSRLKTSRIAPG